MATYGPSNATADTYLSKFNNTSNYNSNTAADIAAPFSNVANRAMLQFDVSTIPTGAVVQSATITARIVTSGSPTGNFVVYPVTRQPTFSQCTWDIYSTGNNWTTAGGDYDASYGSTIAFSAAATPFNEDWSVTTAVQKALDSYRQGNNIILIARCASEAGGGTGSYYVSTIDGVQEATLTVVYNEVTRDDDYNPSGAPVNGTLRSLLEDTSGTRSITVAAAVVASGIDLGSAFGAVNVNSGGCMFDGGGVEIREHGININVSNTTITDVAFAPDTTSGAAIILTDGGAEATIDSVAVSDITILAGENDCFGVQGSDPDSEFTNISFTNFDVDSAVTDMTSKGLLVSGPAATGIDGTFTYTNCNFGSNEPLAIRIPVLSGGLHTFTSCEFVQGWSTGDIKGAHVNWVNCNWVTRAEPGGAGYWYAGRLIGVSFPETTRMYFSGCTLNGSPATYNDLCKIFSVDADVDIPASCISVTPLATVPQNPVPAITGLSVTRILPGSGNTAITVTGTGFRYGTVIRVDGTPVATTLVDIVYGTQISGTIPSAALANPGTVSITAFTPAPGGGESAVTLIPVGLGVTTSPAFGIQGTSPYQGDED